MATRVPSLAIPRGGADHKAESLQPSAAGALPATARTALMATARNDAVGEAESPAGVPLRELTLGLPLYCACLVPNGTDFATLSASPSEASVFWRTEADAAVACPLPTPCPEGFTYVVARFVVTGKAKVLYAKGVRDAFGDILREILGIDGAVAGTRGGAYKVRSGEEAPMGIEPHPLFFHPPWAALVKSPRMWLLLQRLGERQGVGMYLPSKSIDDSAHLVTGESSAPLSDPGDSPRKGRAILAAKPLTEEERASKASSTNRTTRIPVTSGSLASLTSEQELEDLSRTFVVDRPFHQLGNALVVVGAARFLSLQRVRFGGLPPSKRRLVVFPVLVGNSLAPWDGDLEEEDLPLLAPTSERDVLETVTASVKQWKAGPPPSWWTVPVAERTVCEVDVKSKLVLEVKKALLRRAEELVGGSRARLLELVRMGSSFRGGKGPSAKTASKDAVGDALDVGKQLASLLQPTAVLPEQVDGVPIVVSEDDLKRAITPQMLSFRIYRHGRALTGTFDVAGLEVGGTDGPTVGDVIPASKNPCVFVRVGLNLGHVFRSCVETASERAGREAALRRSHAAASAAGKAKSPRAR
jgi:hypothetical protein